jgi:hypothetical protein
MDAKQRLSVDMELSGQTGTSYGGSFDLNLQPYNYSWDYWYSDYYWYGSYSHHWGNDKYYYGYGSGMTQTGF